MKPTQTAYRTCPLCEATCGLELSLVGNRIERIRGDRRDVFSKGFICPKGAALKGLHEDPDRLRNPLVRRGGRLESTDWPTAYAEIERRLGPIKREYGADSIALYLGNPNVHNLGGTLYLKGLLKTLGTRNIFSASTVDQMPKHVSSGLLFGHPQLIPIPDIDRTDYLLIIGANPLVSNGSLCTAPDFPGRLKALRERGGRLVVIDPRRSRTADRADEHLFIRPGSDVYLLFGILQTLFAEGLTRPGRPGMFSSSLEALEQQASRFSPDVVAAHCQLDADTIRRLAREISAAPSAAIYGRIGTCTVGFGTLTSWLVDVIHLLTGNLDRPGGAMFPTAAHSRHRPGRKPGGRGFTIGRWHSRVSNHPEVRSEFPVATLAEEIETPGPGQIKALITVAGNPVLSTPNSARLERALQTLEFQLAVDIYCNETTSLADVILPPPSSLMRSHYDLAFYELAVRNVANYSPPTFDAGDQQSETEILCRLALIAAGQSGADPSLADQMILQQLIQRELRDSDSPLSGLDPQTIATELSAGGRSGPDRLLDFLLRAGPYGDHFGREPAGLTLDRLLEEPHGIDFGPLQSRLPEILQTTSGTIELLAEPLLTEINRLAARMQQGAEPGLLLVGRRSLRSNNSWMHNLPTLVRGRDRCTLWIHPEDATALGVEQGEQVELRSRVGTLEIPAEITDRIARGVVSAPHGWGHNAAQARLQVAAEHAGVNSNLLTDDAVLDPLSGNAVLNGIPVEIAGKTVLAG